MRSRPAPRLPALHPAHLLATWFGSGLLRPGPGSWGSLAALPFGWLIATTLGPLGLLLAAAGLFLAGLWATAVYIRRTPGSADPGAVVVDEVVGMWLVLVPLVPDLLLYALAFLAFRAADIGKPWPAGWVDRHLHGALGVMLDDVIAALYAGAAVFALSFLIGG